MRAVARAIPILDPADVRTSVPRHDLHLHTCFTDGKPTIREYIDRAIELGLSEIGFPEHCNLKTTWLSTFVPALEAERARVAGRLRVHWGIEAKGCDQRGTLAATPAMLEAAEYVYGAFHSSLTKTPFPELPFEQAVEMEHGVTLGMIRARSCDAIAHPGGLSMKYQGSFPDALWEDFAREAAAHDVALELNPGYGANLGAQLSTCIKHGCRVVLGSNAHAIEELGEVTRAFQ
jgi:putative hydrolase